LQGGGAFGAFTWGVLDRLLEEEDIAFNWTWTPALEKSL
jgi:NTE family protein